MNYKCLTCVHYVVEACKMKIQLLLSESEIRLCPLYKPNRELEFLMKPKCLVETRARCVVETRGRCVVETRARCTL